MCCSVLQCSEKSVDVCFSLLSMCCSMLQRVAACCKVFCRSSLFQFSSCWSLSLTLSLSLSLSFNVSLSHISRGGGTSSPRYFFTCTHTCAHALAHTTHHTPHTCTFTRTQTHKRTRGAINNTPWSIASHVNEACRLACSRWYGVATISRLLKVIGLFCTRAL